MAKNHFVVLACVFITVLMFSFSFALSPLYRIICKKTGLNGSVNVSVAEEMLVNKNSKPITVQFLATNNANLPWEFHPRNNSLAVYPEKIAKVVFYAKNNSKKVITVQAVPSFTPGVAAQYFHKIECFCFTRQTLQPGEEKEMPVVFRIDNQLPGEIRTISLAYTLFDVSKRKMSEKIDA